MKYKIMKKMSKPCNFTTLSTGTNEPLVTYGLLTLTFRIAIKNATGLQTLSILYFCNFDNYVK